jgi:hypothetical protein
MSLPAAVKALAFVIFLLLATGCGVSLAQSPGALSANERAELELYRASWSPSYQEYLSRYWSQEVELGDLTVRVLRWQLTVANVVLGLVALLSISGVVLAAYQLWIAGKLALSRGDPSTRSGGAQGEHGSLTSLEMSPTSVRVQTSIVGILILIISGAFLLLFVREVYSIKIVELTRAHDMATPARQLAPPVNSTAKSLQPASQ